MTRTILLLVASASVLFAADNSWDKVKELKSGTEIRIYRAGAPGAIDAKFDEATDDHIVFVEKKEQKSMRKDQVLRLDYRPKPGSRTTETKTTNTPADTTPAAGMAHGAQVPGQSSSTNVSFGKAGYETIYRAVAPHAPVKEK
jgi:hypothetical protein